MPAAGPGACAGGWPCAPRCWPGRVAGQLPREPGVLCLPALQLMRLGCEQLLRQSSRGGVCAPPPAMFSWGLRQTLRGEQHAWPRRSA